MLTQGEQRIVVALIAAAEADGRRKDAILKKHGLDRGAGIEYGTPADLASRAEMREVRSQVEELLSTLTDDAIRRLKTAYHLGRGDFSDHEAAIVHVRENWISRVRAIDDFTGLQPAALKAFFKDQVAGLLGPGPAAP